MEDSAVTDLGSDNWSSSYSIADSWELAPGESYEARFDVAIIYDHGETSAFISSPLTTCTILDLPTNTPGPTPTHTLTPTPTLGMPPAPGNVTITCTVNTTSTVVTLDWDDSPTMFQRVSFQTYRVQFDLTPGMDLVHPPIDEDITTTLATTTYQVTVSGDDAFTVTDPATQVRVEYGDSEPEIAISPYRRRSRPPPPAPDETFSSRPLR